MPVSLDTASFEIGLKTALAKKKDKKAKKRKKAKKDKKAKRDKREKREKNCTRDQPCNDANENRKDEGKGKGKRNRINSLRPGRNPPYFVRFLHILKVVIADTTHTRCFGEYYSFIYLMAFDGKPETADY